MMVYGVLVISFPLPRRPYSIVIANDPLIFRAGVHEITTGEFDVYEKKEEVIFLYFYDRATTSEDFVC
jgi:hypothetical protein